MDMTFCCGMSIRHHGSAFCCQLMFLTTPSRLNLVTVITILPGWVLTEMNALLTHYILVAEHDTIFHGEDFVTEPRFDKFHSRGPVDREWCLQRCATLLRTQLCFQPLQQVRLLCLPAFLHQHVVGVEEGVQRGIEGHQEDGHSDVDLARNRSSCGGQHTQQADREPAQEVGKNNGGQAASDGGVSGPRFR